MVSFELGKKYRKMFFVLSRTRDKEKILSLHEESKLRPSDLCSDAYLMYGSTNYSQIGILLYSHHLSG